MTRREWLEWQMVLSLAPPLEAQMTTLAAAIVLELRRNGRIAVAAAGGKLRDAEPTLETCRLRFGDDLPPGPTRGNWEQSKRGLMQYAAEAQRRKDEQHLRREAARQRPGPKRVRVKPGAAS